MRVDTGANAAVSATDLRKGMGKAASSAEHANRSLDRHGDRPGEHMAAAARANEAATSPSDQIGQIVDHQRRLQTAILSRTDTQTLQFEALDITGGRVMTAAPSIAQPIDLPTLTEVQASRDAQIAKAPGSQIVHEYAPEEPIRPAAELEVGNDDTAQVGKTASPESSALEEPSPAEKPGRPRQIAGSMYGFSRFQDAQNDAQVGVTPSGVHVQREA